MTLRVIIVDDERIARQRLRRLLEKESEVEIVAECADGAATIQAVREHAPDLLLLDIQMPGMDGFDVLDALGPDRQPEVVFVTAFDEHAVKAFEACALDYLLKPASAARLAKALGRVRDRLATGAPAAVASVASSPQRFTVRSGGRISFVLPEEIDWVEAAGNYAILHAGKLNHMVRDTMSALEAQLPATYFLRVSRSVILNLRRVKELSSTPDGNKAALLTDGQRISMTRTLREVKERLRELKM
jgi:two-component system, LytTR family, response regulator